MPRSAAQDQIASRMTAVLSRHREAVIEGMRSALNRPGIEHIRYMRYHLGWEDADGKASDAGGGKMLRPALCLLCCEAAGGDSRIALPAAVAIELLHNFTLIHDDIEDQSDVRHGRPTLWRIVGVPQAINAGDGMFALAQRTLLGLAEAGVPDERVLAASRMLNDACVELCEGQHQDIDFEHRATVSLPEYEAMIGGKSAVLLRAACGVGALAAGADGDKVAAFEALGLSLGLAFQIQDDILGIWGEPNQTGKSAGDDIRTRKKSFPVVYAMEHLDAERREELRRVYEHPAQDADDTATVRVLIESCGARDAALCTAQAHADAAISAIAQVSMNAEHRVELEALARFAVSRDA